jgi:SAM-dependent methyltransferase
MTSPEGFDFDSLFPVDDYLYFLEDTLLEENTPAQVDFLTRALGLNAPARIVDLGCGHGRHALELSRRGHHVLGIDLVDGFITLAQAVAQREELKAEFIRGDVRAMRPQTPMADHAVCLFDAFGFFDDAGQRAMLEAAHHMLEPGGRLVLDLRTREYVLRLPPVSVLEKGSDLMVDRMNFDIETGRLVDERTMVRDGRSRKVRFSMRLYSYTEARALLESVGFAAEAVYGGYDGAPLSLTRSRTILIARKEGTR